MAERAQFQRTLAQRSQSKRQVDTFADQINLLIGQPKIDADIRIAVLKREDQPAGMHHTEGCRAGHPDGAGRRSGRAARFVAGLFDQSQDLNRTSVIAAAFLGQRHAAGGAAQQGRTDCRFELLHLPRHGGLADIQIARDGRQTAAFGDPNEGADALDRDG